MAASVQQILDRARVPLNDADKGRYPDAELLLYLNEVIALVRKSRPDLFIDDLLTEKVVAIGDSSVPVPYTTHQTLADYVTGRAQMKDDDDSGGKQNALIEMALAGIR